MEKTSITITISRDAQSIERHNIEILDPLTAILGDFLRTRPFDHCVEGSAEETWGLLLKDRHLAIYCCALSASLVPGVYNNFLAFRQGVVLVSES